MGTIKKIILLTLTTLMMVGCEAYVDTDYHTREGFRVCTIDSCEYIHQSNGNGAYYVHKGNCKFCAERRRAELLEVVELLKDK